MSFEKDKDFVFKLNRYLNDSDVERILNQSSAPITNANINRRTGRQCLGVPSTRPRKILKPGSLANYKSIILQFAKFKADRLGVMEPINEDIADKYDTEMLRNKRNQTSLTNIRVLNKYVFVPILDKELKKPTAIGPESYCNKPQLTRSEVATTLKYIWRNCKNKDHIFKMFLIYYTGLRSAEALDLTYRDIVNAWTDEHIIISVRRGKNKSVRNIYLFEGAPTHFFRKHLIPYLSLKMLKLLCENKNKTVEDFLDIKIFSDSSYQACQKEFRKSLRAVIQQEDCDDILKGAGLHSIRSDYSTRCLSLVSNYCDNEIFVALKLVSHLMGHTSYKNLFRHYINLGSGGLEPLTATTMSEVESEMEEEEGEEEKEEIEKEREGINVFQHLKRGATVIQALNNRKKSHSNVNSLLNISDNHYLIPRYKKRRSGGSLNRLVYV